jgi:hypothetical protein
MQHCHELVRAHLLDSLLLVSICWVQYVHLVHHYRSVRDTNDS